MECVSKITVAALILLLLLLTILLDFVYTVYTILYTIECINPVGKRCIPMY